MFFINVDRSSNNPQFEAQAHRTQPQQFALVVLHQSQRFLFFIDLEANRVRTWHQMVQNPISSYITASTADLMSSSMAPKGLRSREGLALNKGKIYISKTSPPVVREAYLSQFHEDFTMFLNARSQEVAPNGCMVLILHGRKSSDPSNMESCFTWELLAIAISEL